MIKQFFKTLLAFFGKRLTNYHSSAKPYKEGVVFLRSIIREPAWIIDIGVADGTPELTDAFPYSKHHHLLVEPLAMFSSFLERTAQAYPDTVVVERCVCGETEGVAKLNINRSGHYSSRFINSGGSETTKVPMVTLDQLVEKHKITGPIVLKIDVEGGEYQVLSGATHTLKLCEVVVVETWINHHQSVSGGDFATIVGFMKENGFVVFDFFGGHTHPDGRLRQVDTVFVKEDSSYHLE